MNHVINKWFRLGMSAGIAVWMALPGAMAAEKGVAQGAIEAAGQKFAPEVPAPISRKAPAVVRLDLETQEVKGKLMEGWSADEGVDYIFWTFNGHVPGPFVRVRVGDILEVRLTNPKTSTKDHNIDLHCVTGPGGGAKVTIAKPGETKTGRFQMLNPGLYVYHCAAPPVPDHIANGMYGLILVEPEEGLPKVDREFYVMQGEFYTKGAFGVEGLQEYDPEKGAAEKPTYVVFNGMVKSLMDERALKAKVGETVRIYFGNAGPNLIASFHVIGEIFDKVYKEAAWSEPARNVQTTLVPAGGASIVEFKCEVPGDYVLVDHSIFRIDKGALGILSVTGNENPKVYQSMDAPNKEK